MFNHKMAPLDDVRVRQALNYAVNRDKIIALVLDGQGQPAFSPVASSYAQYNEETETYGFRHDLEKAKALMAEAGLADGFTMSYLNIESPIFRRVAEVIQEDLSQINVSMEIQSYPVAEWFALGGQGKFHTSFFYYTYSDPRLDLPHDADRRRAQLDLLGERRSGCPDRSPGASSSTLRSARSRSARSRRSR